MYFQIVEIGKKSRIVLEAYSSQKSAERKIKKSYPNKETKIISVPDSEVKIGFKIYINDKEYGAIEKESENFWYVRRFRDNGEVIFLKDSFEEKFIKEDFTFKMEEFINE